MNTALGIIIGAVVLIVAYAGIMLAYFALRKRFSETKHLIEIVTVVVVFLMSAVFKFIIAKLATDDDGNMILEDTIANNIALFFHSLYQGVGGLSLEGLADLGDITSEVIRCLYTGTSVLGAFVFISVITATASYEIYSFVQLLFPENNRNIFVFTALTDESIALAKSIKEQYENSVKDGKHGVRKPKIVFAGPGLEPFDRHDGLCREVSANGFLYWSYFQKDDDVPTRSIAKALRLDNRNQGDYSKHFVIFAFGADEHVPQEEDNMNLVFRDIDARLNAKNDDGLRIEYYILTKREVNYQAYGQKIKEYGAKLEEKRKYGLSSMAVIDVFNEAYVIGKNAVTKIMEAGLGKELAVCKGDGYKDLLSVWALGFGGVSESVTRELFVRSPGIGEDNNSRKYIVDVYDNSDSSDGSPSGLFKISHPDYIVTSRTREEAESTETITGFLDYAEAKIGEANQTHAGLPHPVYRFNDMDCCGQAFIESLDKNTGRGKFGQPDVIVIATGDDYRNVRITNAITQDIINESSEKANDENKHRQYIVVNLFDDNNNALISRYGAEASEDGTVIDLPEVSLTIIIIGNLRETYDYARFTEQEERSAEYNYSYQKLSNSNDWDKNALAVDSAEGLGVVSEEINKYIADIRSGAERVDDEKVGKYTDYLLTLAKNIDADGKMHDKDKFSRYYQLDIWTKESNRSACRVSELYRAMYEDLLECPDKYSRSEILAYISAVEHDRWVRHYYSDGWTYASKKNVAKRQHGCLVPYTQASSEGALYGSLVYDYMNAIWAIAKSND